MKNIVIPVLALAIVSLSSCRKERTCSCTTTVAAGGTSTTSTSTETIDKANKRVAKNVTGCYSYKQTETINSVAVETTQECELK